MSTPDLHVIEGENRTFRFEATRVALAMEGHLNSDPWALGDALLKDIEGDRPRSPTTGVNTGLYQQLEEIREEMREAGALTVAKAPSTLRGIYATARHWPREYRRPALATYEAHKTLRSKQYHGTAGAKLLERLHREHPGRRVADVDVRDWRERQQRAAGKMPPPLSREEKLERRLRTSLRSWASPQTFDRLHTDERTLAAGVLRRLAAEITHGEFT